MRHLFGLQTALVLVAAFMPWATALAGPPVAWQASVAAQGNDDFTMAWSNDLLVVTDKGRIRGLHGGVERYAIDWAGRFAAVDGRIAATSGAPGVVLFDSATGTYRGAVVWDAYLGYPGLSRGAGGPAALLGIGDDDVVYRIRPALCQAEPDGTCVERLFDLKTAGFGAATPPRDLVAFGERVVATTHDGLRVITRDGLAVLGIVTAQTPFCAIALGTGHVAFADETGAGILDVEACRAQSRAGVTPEAPTPSKVSVDLGHPEVDGRPLDALPLDAVAANRQCVVAVEGSDFRMRAKVIDAAAMPFGASVVALSGGAPTASPRSVAVQHLGRRTSTRVLSVAADGPRWTVEVGAMGGLDADADHVYVVSVGRTKRSAVALVALRANDGKEAWRVTLPGARQELTRHAALGGWNVISVAAGHAQVAARVGGQIYGVEKPSRAPPPNAPK